MKDKQYPIFFMNDTCVNCGAKHSVKLIDKFDKEATGTRAELYPISHMKCDSCGQEYFIMWETDEDNNFSLPVAISKNYIDLFAKVVDKSLNGR